MVNGYIDLHVAVSSGFLIPASGSYLLDAFFELKVAWVFNLNSGQYLILI